MNNGRPPQWLGITHWSARFMAAELGVSFATVARAWRKWGIQPHRLETFKFSTDPDLTAAIGQFIDACNQRCQPFAWTKDGRADPRQGQQARSS